MTVVPEAIAIEPRSWVHRLGSLCWMLIGIVAFGSIVLGVAASMSGLLVPLVVAVVIGTLAVPIVDRLERVGLPRWAGALIMMASLAAVVVVSVLVATRGVLDQSAEISRVVSRGLDRLNDWLQRRELDLGSTDDQMDQFADLEGFAVAGIASYVGSIFSGVVAVGFAMFLSAFMLFYILVDWTSLRDWVGGHLGVPTDVGSGILDDTIGVLRLGFTALTTSSLLTAVLIGATMVVLDLPLALTIALITFVTSYIPYLGAIFSGAFGFLVALGSGGLRDALILLAVILVVQNLVQTVVGNRLTSTTLAIHPLGGLISTIVGAAAFGFLGGMLAAPFLAVWIRVARRIGATHDVGVAADVDATRDVDATHDVDATRDLPAVDHGEGEALGSAAPV